MTRKFQQSKWTLIGGFVLGGVLLAQPPQGPINPPALPATATRGTFGTTLSSPSGIPSLPTPNNTSWSAIGPASLTEGGGAASGRITGIAVDPTNASNIYVAAAGGGVWNTTTGGSAWTPLTDGQATLSMGALAIAPSNHLHLYAGTGEANTSLDSNYGLGILYSTNGGTSWTLSTGPSGVFASSRLTVSKISVHPTNENIAYAAIADYGENGACCSNTGIYMTTDGGVTWTNTTTAIDAARPWSDVVVDPTTPTIIYAAHGDAFGANSANGVYRSINSGTSWALLTGAPSGNGIGRIAISVAPSATTTNQHVLYVAIATVLGSSSTLYEMLVSQNADATTPTFTNLSNTPNFGGSGGQGWYDWIIAASPTAAGTVYCAGALNYNLGADQVIVTNNGLSGATPTWTDLTVVNNVQPHTDSHAMAFDSSSNMYLGSDGGIWVYKPSVPSWTNLNGNLNTIQFTGIGLHPTSTQTVIGGSQDNGTELTTGSSQWNSTDGGDGGYSQISQTSASIVYSNHPIGSFGSTAFFRKSTDGGNNFISITPTISNAGLFNFYAPIFVDPSNGNRVFLGGDALYESTNAGSSWTTHASPATTPINSIAVLPGGNTIYISTGGTLSTGSQIWVSTNDGSSWTQHSLPNGNAVQEVDIDPNDSTGNTAVAVVNQFNGATGQVFRTVNGGTAWTNISGNLPVLPTWSAKIGTDASKTIYVSQEFQVYSSPSPYGTWTVVGTGLPHAQGVHLELNNTTQELAVATHGRGAWVFSVAPVLVSPAIAKAFNPTSIVSGGSSTVTLTLANSNASALTGGAFSDTLVNMSAVGGSVGGTCAGTTPGTLSAGATALSFTGITIPANGNCTVTFSVTSTDVSSGLPNTTSGVTTTQTPTAGTVSNTANLAVTGNPPTVVSYSVIYGSQTFNMLTSSRNRLPWDVTGIKVVFSAPITSANVNSLTGVTATGFSGLGTNTLTWTFTGITNSAGTLATALASSGPNAIQSAGGTLAAFSQPIKILEGDFNDDGVVNATDQALVNAARSQPFNMFADINGDGVVNTADVAVVRAQNGQSNP